MTADLLLIHPPLVKAGEAPPGIAQLCGSLRARGCKVAAADLNLESQLYRLRRTAGYPVEVSADVFTAVSAEVFTEASCDTWTRRAARHLEENLAALTQPPLYQNFDRYKRALSDLNHLLVVSGRDSGRRISLSDYQDSRLKPVAVGDLLAAAGAYDDNLFFPFFRDRLARLVEREEPQAIGFSLNFLSQALTTFAMLGFCRRHWPRLRLIVGGGLVTTWSALPGFSSPFSGLIDHLVAGPGADFLAGIMAENQSGVGSAWAPEAASPEAASYDPLGVPAALPDCPDYRDFRPLPYFSPTFVLPYAASSGCYWRRCAFCPEKAEGSRYRPKPPRQVLAELDYLRQTLEPGLIHFLDNALSPALLEALADQPPGVFWYGFARVGRRLLDFDFCRRLRAAGCVMLKLGIESGDEKVLAALDKGQTPKEAALALKNLHRAGIATYVYLLFGTPAEDEAAARRTLAFTLQNRAAISFLNLAIFNLPLNSQEAAVLRLREFSPGDLSLYRDFSHPAGWGRLQVRRFLEKEFKRHPDLADIVRRDPPFFTSNHAAFFTGILAEN